jgi:predicted CopG family antitoxin
MPKSAPGKKTISVIVSEDTYEVLKDWAGEKDWSVSQAARKLIEKGLTEEVTKPKDQ